MDVQLLFWLFVVIIPGIPAITRPADDSIVFRIEIQSTDKCRNGSVWTLVGDHDFTVHDRDAAASYSRVFNSE